MPKLTEIRRALEAALPSDLKAEAIPGPQAGDAELGSGRATVEMIVRVYVGPASDEEAKDRLDVLLDHGDPGSLSNALFADPHLGDVITRGLRVLKTSGWRTWQPPNSPPILGAEWTLEVKT